MNINNLNMIIKIKIEIELAIILDIYPIIVFC